MRSLVPAAKPSGSRRAKRPTAVISTPCTDNAMVDNGAIVSELAV
jgi:hypothetical protein